MQPGMLVGNFQLLSRLGRGGMGEVWLAEQLEVGTRVAIKLLLPQISEDAAQVQRFFNEARAAARIQHAGIVRIFDVGHAGERAYLIMELLEGESLAQRIRRTRLTLPQLADICRQVASVLEATHQAGVTHRDLKPDNIFLVRDPEMPAGVRVKVLDFGIAKLGGTLAGASPGTMGTLGTPAYMAPEQWGDASRVDFRADLYSLGCVAFELACGRPPFVATSLMDACAQHLHDAPPRASSLARVPAALDNLIAALLAKSPADRPARMRDVIAAFGALADGSSHADALAATQPAMMATDDAGATVATLPPAMPQRRSRGRALVGGVVAFLLLAGGIAAAVTGGSNGHAPELDAPASQAVHTEASDVNVERVEPPPRAPVAATHAARPAALPAPLPHESRIEPVIPPPDPSANLPIAPTIDEMIVALTPYEPGAAACAAADSPDEIGMEFLIMPSGKLARATPLGAQAHTELGHCVSRAMIRARFPETQRGATQTFTIKLR